MKKTMSESKIMCVHSNSDFVRHNMGSIDHTRKYVILQAEPVDFNEFDLIIEVISKSTYESYSE